MNPKISPFHIQNTKSWFQILELSLRTSYVLKTIFGQIYNLEYLLNDFLIIGLHASRKIMKLLEL